jgi:cobalt/nickel transport system permease protein
LHHVVLEQWSRGRSLLHARDARAKILVLATVLVVIATSPVSSPAQTAAYALFLACAILIARLPILSVLVRSAVVLPFAATFAAISVLAGDTPRAAALVQKSYLSALAVLVVVATTPMPELLRGLESLGLPRFLLVVVQFLYRYLFVISEQAQHMRMAAASRGYFLSTVRDRSRLLRAAGGALAVLFARSYDRAEGIHRAMLARCFQGHFPSLSRRRFGWADALFVLIAASVPVALRIALTGSG